MLSTLISYIKISLAFGIVLVLGTSSLLNADAWVQPPTEFSTSFSTTASAGDTDGNGNALSVWSEGDIPGFVAASYYTNGAWQPAVILSSSGSTDQNGLDVAMDATGTGLALWSEAASNQIRGAHFSGGVWTLTTPDPIDNVGEITGQLKVAMNGTGNGVGIWIDFATNQVRSSFYNAGTNSWSPVSPVNVLGTGSFSANVAYSANGTAIASWNDGTNAFASYFNGTIWLAAVILGPSVDIVVSDIDASGNALVAWFDTTTGNVLSSTIVGATVTGPTTIALTAGNVSLSIAVAPGGTAILTWVDAGSVGLYSTYTNPTWSSGLPYAINVFPFGGRSTDVSVDSLGNALIVYGTNTDQIISVQLPLGGLLGAPLLVATMIDGLGNTLQQVTSALSSNGIGFAFWLPSNEGVNSYASVLLPTPIAPGVLIVTPCINKFASQTDHVNILNFAPVTDPVVIAYYIRRNGVLIAALPATGPYIFFDHNRCRRVTGVYALTSVTATGVESVPSVVVVP